MLIPLRRRNFALLWLGTLISLVGDGIFVVALAWQALDLDNDPTSLALVGLAWTLPQVVVLLLSGYVVDRFDRRRVLLFSDAARGAIVAAMGTLIVSDAMTLESLYVLVALYGLAEAFYLPAFGAIVPDLVDVDDLVHANALDQFIRPGMLQVVGPIVAGALIAAADPGVAFLADAVTFAVSAAAILAMDRRQIKVPTRDEPPGRPLAEIAEGLRYVRRQRWLLVTLLTAAVAYLAFYGPFQVLVPFLIRNELDAGAGALGLVLGAGGVGALAGAVLVSHRGMPRRTISFMFGAWAVALACLAGFGVSAAVWQAAVASFVLNALLTSAIVVFTTLKHVLVPQGLMGRVSGVEWLVVSGLLPVSFALTGPIAAAAGTRETLIGAGVAAALTVLLFMQARGLRDVERDPRVVSLARREPAPGAAVSADG